MCRAPVVIGGEVVSPKSVLVEPQGADKASKSDGEEKDRVPAHLWQLYGEYYDLQAFSRSHPGGEAALALGRGDDATKLFESYHVMNDNHKTTLAKYRLERDDKKPVPGNVSPFHTEVKDMLRLHFAGKGRYGHHAKYSHALLMAGVLVLYALSWVSWYHGNWSSLIVMPFFGWLVMANLAHDGSHFAVSRHDWVNQLCLYSAAPFYYVDATWYVQHVASHHLATNDVEHDVDLHHHDGCRWHSSTKLGNPLNGKINLAWHLTAFIASTITMAFIHPVTKFVLPGIGYLRGATELPLKEWGASVIFDATLEKRLRAGFGSIRRMSVNGFLWVIAMAVPIHAWCKYGFTTRGTFFGLLPYVASSFFFMIVTQVSHVQRETQRHEAAHNDDFFKAQAMTSLDYSIDSPLWCFLTGGLNTQSVHHVLPSVHSSHYLDLYPKFAAICKKHNCEPQNARDLGHAFAMHIQYVYELGEEGSNNELAKAAKHD